MFSKSSIYTFETGLKNDIKSLIFKRERLCHIGLNRVDFLGLLFQQPSHLFVIVTQKNPLWLHHNPFTQKPVPAVRHRRPNLIPFFPVVFSNHSIGTLFPTVSATEIGFFLTSSNSSCVNGSV